MKKYRSKSAQETQAIASQILAEFLPERTGVVYLIGDLGTGKTTFTQGLAKSLDIQNKILSPSFVLERSYPIPHTAKFLHHIDLYRLGQVNSLAELGLIETLNDPNNLTVIEWANFLLPDLKQPVVVINFKQTGELREITVQSMNR